jgi:hypothetical protein
MSLRSRNYTAGLIGGFLGSNRIRREKMEKRTQFLADNRALQDREMAKSRYQEQLTSAKAEQAEVASLVQAGRLKTNDLGELEYQESHWRELAYEKWKDAGGHKDGIANFNSQPELIANAKSGQATKYQRRYRDATEYDSKFQATLDQILEKQKKAGEARGLTDFDRMFASDRVIDENDAMAADSVTNTGMEEVAPLSNGPMDFHEDTGIQAPVVPISVEFDPKSAIQVYGRDEKGGVDTSTQHTLYINKGDGKLYEATGTGPVPWDGDYVSVEQHGNTAKSRTNLSVNDYKNDINVDTIARFNSANKSIKLAKGIADLAGVETTAVVSTLPAKIANFLGTEWEALKDNEESKQAYVNEKIDAIVRTDEDADPETLSEISAALGKMDSQKLALAYAVVKMNRGRGRFSAQELNNQLELYKDKGLPYMLSSLNTTYGQALNQVKRDVKNMAAEATVVHLVQTDKPQSKSQIIAALDTEPRRDTNGDWVILIRPEDQDKYGARYIVVSPDGGVHYNQ